MNPRSARTVGGMPDGPTDEDRAYLAGQARQRAEADGFLASPEVDTAGLEPPEDDEGP